MGRRVAQEEFLKKHACYSRVMQELFNDPAWVRQNIDQSDLNRKLYEMASSIQGTELRGKVSLYDLFYEEELYQNWVGLQRLVANELRLFSLYGQCSAFLSAQPSDGYNREG